MSAKTKTSFRTELRKAFWPIEWHENKKFIPMALMMAFILFNYAMLRTIKDGLVVTNVGAEALGFLKTYFVLPSAVLMVVLYTKLCNIMNQQRVFYTITLFFLTYLAIFTFVLYPYPEFFLPSADKVELWSQKLPNLKWFVKIGGFWTYATFYVVAELWGSMMMSLLFWQFANQITKTSEAKRFYSMFGLLGNFGLPMVALVTWLFLKKYTNVVPSHISLMPILTVTLLAGLVVLALYRWINNNVLTDPTLYDPNAIGAPKKKKAKLSVMESFKMILTSKYLGLIALLIIGYSISINLVEGVWKAKVRELYPTIEGYTYFMSTFQLYQGITAIIFMLIGANILRRVTWNTAALFTPLMILFTGLAFFAFILFDKTIGLYLAMLFGSGPLMMAVMVGTAQNVLSKAVKYSLFDSTKEMAYIPLDDEMKSKGKAAVDVIGGRFGKSGGGLIQSSFFIMFPAFSFVEATPYFGAIFFVIVIAWIYAVSALGHEYRRKLLETGEAKTDKEVLKEAKIK